MFKIGDEVECVDNFGYELTLSKGEKYTVEGTDGYQFIKVQGYEFWFDPNRFVLSYSKQEEGNTSKLKQNWSIRVHSKEQAEVYEKTLIALGYALTSSTFANQWGVKVKSLRCSVEQQNHFLYSYRHAEEYQFENLESFLAWHFQEEETEQQKQIRELEETIQKAQQKIEQLKKGL